MSSFSNICEGFLCPGHCEGMYLTSCPSGEQHGCCPVSNQRTPTCSCLAHCVPSVSGIRDVTEPK
jgi:hypothetical protein